MCVHVDLGNDFLTVLTRQSGGRLNLLGGFVLIQLVNVEDERTILTKSKLPEIKRFTHEKIYPCVAEKWDEWRERCKRRKSGEQTPRASAENQFSSDLEGDSPRVIKLESYRKEA